MRGLLAVVAAAMPIDAVFALSMPMKPWTKPAFGEFWDEPNPGVLRFREGGGDDHSCFYNTEEVYAVHNETWIYTRYWDTGHEGVKLNKDNVLRGHMLPYNRCVNFQKPSGMDWVVIYFTNWGTKGPKRKNHVCEFAFYQHENCHGKLVHYYRGKDVLQCKPARDSLSMMMSCGDSVENLEKRGGTPWRDSIGWSPSGWYYDRFSVWAERMRRACKKEKGDGCDIKKYKYPEVVDDDRGIYRGEDTLVQE